VKAQITSQRQAKAGGIASIWLHIRLARMQQEVLCGILRLVPRARRKLIVASRNYCGRGLQIVVVPAELVRLSVGEGSLGLIEEDYQTTVAKTVPGQLMQLSWRIAG
jgi:hypothetical protein